MSLRPTKTDVGPTDPSGAPTDTPDRAAGRHFAARLPSELTLLLATAAVGTLLIFLRRPDAFVHPKFWAEDGVTFYAGAFRHGSLGLLFQPVAGYLELQSRLVAALATGLPMAWAPTIFLIVGLGCQLLPALLLVSARSEALIGTRWRRIAAALFYLALPDTIQLDVNLTNAQWHLAAAALLIVLTRDPRTARGRWFDYFVLVLSGLTGPFSIVLAPVAGLAWIVRRSRRQAEMAAAVIACALIQAGVLLTSPRLQARSLDAGASLLARIFAGRMVLDPAIGNHVYLTLSRHLASGAWVAIALVGAMAMALVSWRAGPEARLVALFGMVAFASGLAKPYAATWPMLAGGPGGARYFFLPMFAVILLVATASQLPRLAYRVGAAAYLLAALCIGIRVDWRYPPLPSDHWASFARQYALVPPGTAVTEVENPQGWSFTLVKH